MQNLCYNIPVCNIAELNHNYTTEPSRDTLTMKTGKAGQIDVQLIYNFVNKPRKYLYKTFSGFVKDLEIKVPNTKEALGSLKFGTSEFEIHVAESTPGFYKFNNFTNRMVPFKGPLWNSLQIHIPNISDKEVEITFNVVTEPITYVSTNLRCSIDIYFELTTQGENKLLMMQYSKGKCSLINPDKIKGMFTEIKNTVAIKQVEDPELEVLWIPKNIDPTTVPHQTKILNIDRDYVQVWVPKSKKYDLTSWLLDNQIWSFYFTPLFKEVSTRAIKHAAHKSASLTKIYYYILLYYIKGSWPDWVDDCVISHDLYVSCGGTRIKYTTTFTEIY